jgi:hypothetical protein
MFGIDTLLWLGVSGAAAVYSYVKSRQFVRGRLRFVDAVQNPVVPLVAGIGVAIVLYPLSFLPIITVGTGLLVGLGVGTGVLHGSKDVKRLPRG